MQPLAAQHRAVHALASAQSRAVTLVGPASPERIIEITAVAGQLEARLKCEVLWVHVADLEEAGLIHERIVQATGMHDTLQLPAGEQADQWLLNRNVLIVLDEADAVAPAIELEVLLNTHRRARVLASASAPLGYLQERVIGLQHESAGNPAPTQPDTHAGDTVALSTMQRLEALLKQFNMGDRTGAMREMGAALPQARAALRWAMAQTRPDVALRIFVALSRYLYLTGKHREGLRIGTRVLGLAARAQLDAPHLLAMAHTAVGTFMTSSPAAEAPIAHFQRALQLLAGRDDQLLLAQTHAHLGFALQRAGQIARAQRALGRAMSISNTLAPLQHAIALLNVGGIATASQDHALSQKVFERAAQIARELFIPLLHGFALVGAGTAAFYANDNRTCEAHLTEAAATNEPLIRGYAAAGLCRLACRRRQQAQALQWASEAVQFAVATGSQDLQFSTLHALAVLAERVDARVCGIILATANVARQHSYLLRAAYDQVIVALSDRVRPRLGGAQWEAAQREGRALSIEDAHALLAKAMRRVKAAPAPPVLSPREQEVMRAVADGLTNAQTAARLVVSQTTVNAHLRNIFAKLNVRSRTAAIAAYRELG